FNTAWGVDTPPAEIIGTGPFTLVEYSPGESMTFKRNPYYWKLDADGRQLPFLEGGVTQIVPDINTTLQKFKSGECDYVSIPLDLWNDIKRGETEGGYKTMDCGPNWGISYLCFNMNPRAGKLAKYKREWFSKKEFRQAVSYALDRDAMV